MPILYPTRFLKNNVGDVLINVLLIRELSKHDIVYLDSNLPDEIYNLIITNNKYTKNVRINTSFLKGFSNYPIIRWIALLPLLKTITKVFTVPGHHYGKYSLKTILQDIKSFLRVFFLSRMGINVYSFGVTIGPYSPFRWRIQKKILSFYQLICIRDMENFHFLKKQGLKSLLFIDDLSFLFEEIILPSESFLSNIVKKPYIVISFRGNISGKKLDKKYLSEILDSLILFFQKNRSLVDGKKIIVSFQVDDDYLPCEYLYSKLSNKFDCKFLAATLSLGSAANLYKNAEIVITNRLHVALLAMFNSTVAISLTDIHLHTKLVNIYKQLGFNKLLFDINDSKLKFQNNEDILKEISKVISKKRKNIQTTVKNVINNI